MEGIFITENASNLKKELIFNLLKESSENLPVMVLCKDALKALKTFFKDYEWVEAAGGIVKRKEKYLFIKRNGVWDLPKGKLDPEEESEVGAIREIHEECGVLCSKVQNLLLETYHIYEFKGKNVLKKTYWYALSFKGKQALVPQTEEGITKVKWLKKSKLKKVYKNTYPSILDVMGVYFEEKEDLV